MSVLDTEILGQLQDILVEPNDGGLTWPSGLWTSQEVVDYLNQRQRRFLQETQAIVARATQGIVPAVPRQTLPQDWIATRRVSYQPIGFDLFNGLISFWRLQEGLGANRLDSIGPNDLIPGNAPSQAPGKIGEAAGFDATLSQSLEITDGAQVGLNPGFGNYSISTWFFPTAIIGANTYSPVSKGGSGGLLAGYNILLRGPATAIPLQITVALGDNTGRDIITFNEKFTLNAWNHFVLVANRSGGIALAYLNGTAMTPVTTAAITRVGLSTPTASFAIGAHTQNGAGDIEFFSGNIDATGFWSRTLSLAEVAVLWNGGLGRELYPAVRVVTPTGTSFQALSPGDQFEMDNFEPTWATSPQTRPWLYSDADPETLEVVILPPSLGNGTLHLLYVQQPTQLTGAGTAFSVPDEFVPTLKWGALEDMLSKVGRAHDPIRAKVAGDYYSFGVEAAKALLQGFA